MKAFVILVLIYSVGSAETIVERTEGLELLGSYYEIQRKPLKFFSTKNFSGPAQLVVDADGVRALGVVLCSWKQSPALEDGSKTARHELVGCPKDVPVVGEATRFSSDVFVRATNWDTSWLSITYKGQQLYAKSSDLEGYRLSFGKLASAEAARRLLKDPNFQKLRSKLLQAVESKDEKTMLKFIRDNKKGYFGTFDKDIEGKSYCDKVGVRDSYEHVSATGFARCIYTSTGKIWRDEFVKILKSENVDRIEISANESLNDGKWVFTWNELDERKSSITFFKENGNYIIDRFDGSE